MTVTAETTGPEAITGTWAIDPTHTTIGFTIRHAMIAKVRGRFAEFEGTFVIDGANVGASTASLTIQSASFSTDNADRDGHEISPSAGLIWRAHPHLRLRPSRLRLLYRPHLRLCGHPRPRPTLRPCHRHLWPRLRLLSRLYLRRLCPRRPSPPGNG
jgi:hypothetical protein